MKIGEIKIEALKLMFVNYAFDINMDNLVEMSTDENYGSYLVNMNGSINRAIDRIQNACVVSLKRYEIKVEDLIVGKYRDRFLLSNIEDLFVIDRLVAESDGMYDGNAEYSNEGDAIVLSKGISYTILYYPTIKGIDDSITDEDTLEGIPDNIARIIPLFIKGDLYEDEEPKIAYESRNQFEALLQDLKRNTVNNQTRIRKVL